MTSSRVADQHFLPQLLHTLTTLCATCSAARQRSASTLRLNAPHVNAPPQRSGSTLRTSTLRLNGPSQLFVELKDKVHFNPLLLSVGLWRRRVGGPRRSDWSESYRGRVARCGTLRAQINKEFVISDWKHRLIITARQRSTEQGGNLRTCALTEFLSDVNDPACLCCRASVCRHSSTQLLIKHVGCFPSELVMIQKFINVCLLNSSQQTGAAESLLTVLWLQLLLAC